MVERGTFEHKLQLAWDVYDVFGSGKLDILTLRELIKRCYSAPAIQIERVIDVVKRRESWFFAAFSESFESVLTKHLPVL